MHKEKRRWELRERTTEAHEALDVLIGDFTDETAYRRYLSGMAAFRYGVEASLSPERLPPALSGFEPSLIGSELRADLGDLGLAQPRPATPAPITSADDAIGVLYVLEGSALGAQLLVRRAAELGFDGSRGARHLVRQSSSLDNWRAFLKLLDDIEPFDVECAAQSASRTFRAAQGAFGANAYA